MIDPEIIAQRHRQATVNVNNTSSADRGRPVIQPTGIRYELSERVQAISCGGVGLIHQFSKSIQLPEAIDRNVHVLKFHKPYHESDHVLTIACNLLAGGTCLEDLDETRFDPNLLQAFGTDRLPDPTTLGDFCRRFDRTSLDGYWQAIDTVRKKVWQRQDDPFFECADVDLDGTVISTTGERKSGMDWNQVKKVWGYHPLVVSLANTGEVLRLINRSGNRPSHEGAADRIDELIPMLRDAGFRTLRFRGDTDFSQSRHLDRWAAEDDVQFVFGYDARPELCVRADDLPNDCWEHFERDPQRPEPKKRRRRRPNVKQAKVEERGFRDQRLECEWVAEFEHSPTACHQTYRMVVIRKDLSVSDEGRLFDDYKYFFYITNIRDVPAAEIVRQSNLRCDQERQVIRQLKQEAFALVSPLDSLESNDAYMAFASLAWNLKVWFCLDLPEAEVDRDNDPGPSRRGTNSKRELMRMGFRKYLREVMLIPCQIIKTGRRLIYRLLGHGPRWWAYIARCLSTGSSPGMPTGLG